MDFLSPDEVKDIANVMHNWNKEKISKYRQLLLSDINGQKFYSMHLWPKNIIRVFWLKPMTHRQTFMLMCFLVGNGCNVRLAVYWILMAVSWAPKHGVNSRCNSIIAFANDLPQKRHVWFYYDMRVKQMRRLDGSRHFLYGYVDTYSRGK